MIKHAGNTGDFIEIIVENCKGCGKCVIICPMDLWSIENKKAKISEDYKKMCLECAHCYSICEYDAINFHYPKGGTGVIYKYG